MFVTKKWRLRNRVERENNIFNFIFLPEKEGTERGHHWCVTKLPCVCVIFLFSKLIQLKKYWWADPNSTHTYSTKKSNRKPANWTKSDKINYYNLNRYVNHLFDSFSKKKFEFFSLCSHHFDICIYIYTYNFLFFNSNFLTLITLLTIILIMHISFPIYKFLYFSRIEL